MKTYTQEQIVEKLQKNEEFLFTTGGFDKFTIGFRNKETEYSVKKMISGSEKEGFEFNKIIDTLLIKLRAL